jgi:hypothetical protein
MSHGLGSRRGHHHCVVAGLDVHFVGSPDVDVREHSGGRIILSPLVNQLGEALYGARSQSVMPNLFDSR